MNTPQYPDRVRQHEANHIRHIDVQVLDALLRIEELLVGTEALLLKLVEHEDRRQPPAPKALAGPHGDTRNYAPHAVPDPEEKATRGKRRS